MEELQTAFSFKSQWKSPEPGGVSILAHDKRVSNPKGKIQNGVCRKRYTILKEFQIPMGKNLNLSNKIDSKVIIALCK